MKKIPTTWQRVEGAKCEPERLELVIPCTAHQAEFMETRFHYVEKRLKDDIPGHVSLAQKPGATTYMKDGSRKFERCNGVWTERKRIRNPDYVVPPFFQIVYGIHKIDAGGCFFCKFPPGLRSRVMRSAITTVARSYGHPDSGKDRYLLEGCDQELWDKNTTCPRYEWDGKKLTLIDPTPQPKTRK